MKTYIPVIFLLCLCFPFALHAQSSDDSLQVKQKGDILSKGKVILHVFGNLDYEATKGIDKRYRTNLGRAHLGYEYQFNEKFSAKLVVDAGRPTTLNQIEVTDPEGNQMYISSTYSEGSHYTMFLKFASVEWKPNDFITVQIGGVLQNHYITQEKFWGYRYVAETFQDRYYRTPSTDWGAIGYFTICKKLSADLAITNGEGIRSDQDQYGDIKIASGITYQSIDGLQTRFFYDYTKSNKPLSSVEKQLFSFFAGYKINDKYRIGGEYNYTKNHLHISGQDSYGYSLFGSYSINEQFGIFLRFDQLQANKVNGMKHNWNYDNTGKGYISGIQYTPVEGVNFSLNYQGWQPDNSDLNFRHRILLSFECKL